MLISDTRIFELAVNKGMISPFIPEQVKTLPSGARTLSFGASSYGYDVTLAEEFKMFTNYHGEVIDPKKPSDRNFVDMQLYTIESTGEKFIIMPPHSYVLGRTIEHFVMPRNVTAVAVGKSTYARAGCIVNVTPIEAGFEGEVVIELSNSTDSHLRVYANEGIAQFLFFESDEPCNVSYADRAGKYQGLTGLTLGRV